MNFGSRKSHKDHVDALKDQLRQYGFDPFSDNAPRNFSTGQELDESVVCDMINAESIGDIKFLDFVESRLIRGNKDFFVAIPKTKLSTGVIKKKTTPKAFLTLMKEDRQAFGLIISKAVSINEAFMYPITSVPLALATTENGLRQSDKASFRNSLINEANSDCTDVPKNCTWLIDGMAAVRSLKPKDTYHLFYISLLKFITPCSKYDPKTIVFCIDRWESEVGVNIRGN